MRIHELAKKLNITSQELISELHKLKVDVKGHMSSIDDDTAILIQQELKGKKVAKKVAKKIVKKEKEIKKTFLKKIQVRLPIMVNGLAIKLGIKSNELLKRLLQLNIIGNINKSLDENVIKLIAGEFNYEIEILPSEEEAVFIGEEDDASDLTPRPPVVTLMGHVDHGKTSLLDVIRETNITSKEAGKITQHIGAYKVSLDKGQITFLDTPGHEAFTAMRARGANVTDIVVLVVAADEGARPQTIEAIDHARAAGVPIVLAINKIDLPNANITKVKRQFQSYELVSEDMGGKTITVAVSAKTKEGINELLEMLLLEAEMLELKANPHRLARGIVIEGKLSAGRGAVATVLVKNGTLRLGDVVISGLYYGKVKSMRDDRGQQVKDATPSVPVEISGFSGLPEAGDEFIVIKNEKLAKEIVRKRKTSLKEKKLESTSRVSLEDFYKQIKEGQLKELKIIIKADVQGSVEALQDSLKKLSTEEVKLKVIHGGAGRVNESDIMLAAASQAIIIGFHIKRDMALDELIEKEKVDVRFYDIIYEAISDIRAAMEGLLEPGVKKVLVGRAEVREVFRVSRVGAVAGCFVKKGKVVRNLRGQVIRDGEIVYSGSINSLKRFKEDAKEVEEGFECGIGFGDFNDIKARDIIECYRIEKVTRRL